MPKPTIRSIRTVCSAALALLIVLPLIIHAPAPSHARQDGGVLNIYSARHYGAMEAPFVAFTDATGIEVRVSQGSPRALLERLRAEGERTPADLFLAVDAGVLALAADEGLLQPVDSDVLRANVPETLRDPADRWFALSLRPRTIMYNPATVDPAEVTTYSALADPQWAGRLCMRPATHIYTVSLVSSLIYNLGEDAAEEIVRGWVANDPTYINSDTRLLETVAAGGCDVAIANTYYLARLKADDPDFPVEQVWANQDTTGTFFNINGAGVTAGARNVENAIAFLEFFSTEDGQAGTADGFPGSNYEYPANPDAELNPQLAALGDVMLDTGYPLWEYGALQASAVDLLERAGYGFDES